MQKKPSNRKDIQGLGAREDFRPGGDDSSVYVDDTSIRVCT